MQKEYSKQDLVKIIKKVKKDLCIIGTVAFDLPWEELYESLESRFIKDELTISILRESETAIAQYALLTTAQMQGSLEGGNLSRGNLTGIKDKVIKELKERFTDRTNGKNVEPPEDVYAQDLGKIMYDTKRNYLLNSYKLNDCLLEFYDYLKKLIIDEITKSKKKFFMDSYYIDHAVVGDLDFTTKYTNAINQYVEKRTMEICDDLLDVELLGTLEIDKKGIKVIIEKNGDSVICVDFEKEFEGKTVYSTAILEINDWIDNFMVRNTTKQNMDEINYRIKADKRQAIKRATEERGKRLKELCSSYDSKQRLFIKNCYLPIPVPMIKIDNMLFITHALTKFDSIDKFQYIGNFDDSKGYESYWFKEFSEYYNVYFENLDGAQRYSTEETKKGNKKEVIDIFNESRIRIGTGPRDAFLANMAIVKSVVWALIFDREGRILIHKRSANAKDNQGLWDKSVGGHVSTEDLDTIEAVKREIAEELYTIEKEGQSGHDNVEWMITNKNKIIYLGDWLTSRFPDLKSLHLKKDEYYNFSLNYLDRNRRDFRKEIVITERVLPDETRVKAKTFVDAYLCVVSEDFDISKLQNSKFAMLTPNELKSCVMSGVIYLNNDRYYDRKGNPEDFLVTSDLEYLVNSAIWDDVVTEFSQRIKEAFGKK